MRFVLPALLALAPTVAAQKVCASANTTSRMTGQNTPVNAWFALPFRVAQRTAITACDFRLNTNRRLKRDGTAAISIWNDNNGVPGRIVARGTITVSEGIPEFYGAKFNSAVVVQPGLYYVAMRNTGGVDVVAGGPVTPYYWGPPVFRTWNGPIRRVGWGYRVYCGTHGGSFVSHGTAKAGSGAVAPRLRGLGQPNTTNRVDIQMSRGLGGAPAVFVWGARTSQAFALGTLYATPLAVFPVVLARAGSGVGHATLSFVLPNAAALRGVKVAMQGWVRDPRAAAGWSHTAGLEMTIGH